MRIEPRFAFGEAVIVDRDPGDENDVSEKFLIEIVAYEGDKVERQIGPVNGLRVAERTERGVNINLDHRRFYKRIAAAE